MRLTAMKNLKTLPAVQVPNASDASEKCELVCVCGAADAEMGVWATWSFARQLRIPVTVIVDGVIPDEIAAVWQSLIQGVQIVSRDEADRRAMDRLAPYPYILQWRRENRTGRKLADPHLWGDSPNVLIIDSDVLCLSYPVDLAKQIAACGATYTWNADMATYYVAPIDLLNMVMGVRLPERVNSGLMLHPRSSDETFRYVESLLEKICHDGSIRFRDRWFEQTLAASCIARFAPNSLPLPRGYDVVAGRTKRTQVVRHFVGSPLIRPRFYSEGIPQLIRNLGD